MRQELTCITCPIGCRLVAESGSGGELVVSGNRCPRGAAYAREELLAPKRTVTATCRSFAPAGGAPAAKRIPCRTTAPFPRETGGRTPRGDLRSRRAAARRDGPRSHTRCLRPRNRRRGHEDAGLKKILARPQPRRCGLGV